MKLSPLAIGLFLLGSVGASYAAPCGCPARLSPVDELTASTAVIEAYVVSVGSTTGDSTAYNVDVNKVWKGEPMKDAVIHTRGVGTNCAVAFEVGKNYLVYAKGADLETDACSRTFDASTLAPRLDYQEDLAAFKQASH